MHTLTLRCGHCCYTPNMNTFATASFPKSVALLYTGDTFNKDHKFVETVKQPIEFCQAAPKLQLEKPAAARGPLQSLAEPLQDLEFIWLRQTCEGNV